MSSEDRPLFSLVTVTKNAGAELARTISSVRSQTQSSYEHVIKDAGSTDGSISSVSIDSRTRVIVKADSGIYDAMNQALEMCRGDYVLFLNAGDVFATVTVLDEVGRVAREERPSIIYCDVDDRSARSLVRYPDDIGKFFLYRTMVCHQALFVLRRCYDEIGRFELSFRVAADHEFLARAVVAHGLRPRHVSIVGVVYRGDGFSSLRDSRSRLASEVEMIRQRHYPAARRWIYGAVLLATLAGLRNSAMASERMRWARPAYIASRNAAYGMWRHVSARLRLLRQRGRANRTS